MTTDNRNSSLLVGVVGGCVTTKQVKEIPRGEWGQMKVGEIATQCSDKNTIGPLG
jgi:hypothetical protein